MSPRHRSVAAFQALVIGGVMVVVLAVLVVLILTSGPTR